MLHWLKALRPATGNCENCPDLESRITFLEQQIDEYRSRLDAVEKLHNFVNDTVEKTTADTQRLFQQIGQIKDSAHEVWQCACTLNTALSRIKEAQATVDPAYGHTTEVTETPSTR